MGLRDIIICYNLNKIQNSDNIGNQVSNYLTKAYEYALNGEIDAVKNKLESALSERQIGPKGCFDREINTAKMIYTLAKKKSKY